MCGKETETGYGLAYGHGIGSYEFCKFCDWYEKYFDEGEKNVSSNNPTPQEITP